MTEEEQKKTSKNETTSRYELVEVPTQTTILFRDGKSDVVLDEKQALLEILNKVDKLVKELC